MPGSPFDPRSEGTNGLLKQGAAPVTDAADVIAMTEPILGRGIRVASAEEAAQPPSRGRANAPDGVAGAGAGIN